MRVLFFLTLLVAACSLCAQTDTTAVDSLAKAVIAPATDSVSQDSASLRTWMRSHVPAPFLPQKRPPYNPEIAWKRALLFPGWGQMYNRDYWKLPIVYGALGIFAFQVWSNNAYYQQYRTLYRSYVDTTVSAPDSIKVLPWVRGLDTRQINETAARTTRNNYRTSRDRMIIFGLFAYGLTAVEAYVDAHLKSFDVSKDLSMKISPALTPAGGALSPGLRLAWRF